jgi:selenocysteine lyase/cysteine desulfurase
VEGKTQNAKFDGKDCPYEGLAAYRGSSSSAQRVDERIRVAPHLLNNPADIDRLLAVANDWASTSHGTSS